ncbi:MAG: carboxypeptidase regulatory-like domain-containing protein [Actinomycetota bacterium]
MITQRALITTLLAAALAAPALAAGPEEQTQGSTRYLTGGIGQDEVQALREASSRYPLAMTFTANTGQYVADVKVTIKGRKGETLLDTVSTGPMMLVDLPPGQYTVAATLEGKTLTRKVTLAKNTRHRLVLRWENVSA